MTYEFIRIEKQPVHDYLCVPWFTISQCHGRQGRTFQAHGFASELGGIFKEIALNLLSRGIQSGQRGVIRLLPSGPYQLKGYFTFYAN